MPFNYKTEIQRYRKYYHSLEPILIKPKSKAYTTVVFSFLAVSLFSWYAIMPTIQTILFLQREIRDKTDLNTKMEDKIAALIEAQSYYQDIEPNLPAVNEALPVIPDAIPLMIQLRNLASMSGTLISAVQLPSVPLTSQETVITGKTGVKMPINAPLKQQTFDLSISIKGTYAGLRGFLEGVTRMRRIVVVDSYTVTPIRTDSISVASGSAAPTDRFLQLALKLKAYYLVSEN
jgi:hypothetical protein